MPGKKEEKAAVIVNGNDILFAWAEEGGFGIVEYAIGGEHMSEVDWLTLLRGRDWWCLELECVFLIAMYKMYSSPSRRNIRPWWLPVREI